jgi:hypothetical protein
LTKTKLQDELQIAVSKTIKIAIKPEAIIAAVDNIHEPAIPMKRPKKKQEMKLKKGNTIIHKYIENYFNYYYVDKEPFGF